MRRLVHGAVAAALVAGGLTAGVAVPAQAAGTETTSTCAKVVVMALRGSGEGTARTSTAYGYFGTRNTVVAKKVLAGLPSGTTVRFKGIDYPAVSATAWKNYIVNGTGRSAMTDSVAKGRDALKREINRVTAGCSASKIVVLGY